VNFYQSIRIHGANERIRLDWFDEGVAFLRSVVGTWASGTNV
jgi:acetylornithine deacetylase/succinyl-diaminopimelate desuccinylase-like protein